MTKPAHSRDLNLDLPAPNLDLPAPETLPCWITNETEVTRYDYIEAENRSVQMLELTPQGYRVMSSNKNIVTSVTE